MTDININKFICNCVLPICNTISPTIIVGDFNLPLYNKINNMFPNSTSSYVQFENSLCQNALIQLITFPTRNNTFYGFISNQ